MLRWASASVHLARIGHNTPGFNWYGTERLIRKHLASKGIPTYMYPNKLATTGVVHSALIQFMFKKIVLHFLYVAFNNYNEKNNNKANRNDRPSLAITHM